jgi:predicted nuclease with RNAse H fold
MRVLGVDLAGCERNPTGFCVLQADSVKSVETVLLHSDSEILGRISSLDADLVAIDAPLVYGGARRMCDELLRDYGVLPATLGGMETLALRGRRLAGFLDEAGVDYIEVSVRASAKILGLNAKKDFDYQKRIMGLDLSGCVNSRILCRDELDSIVAAITGFLNLTGLCEKVGEDGGSIVVPRV